MKYLSLTKRRLFLFLLFALIFVFGIGILKGPLLMNVETMTGAVTGVKKLRPIYNVNTSEPKVAISFDASWGATRTEELLRILDKYEVKTTFFLVNLWLDKYPVMASNIVKRGHEIGMHSKTHPDFAKLSREQMIEEIEENQKKIVEVTGFKPILFRPPFGSYNNTLIEVLDSLKYYCIQWDVDSLDWKDLSADNIYQRVTSKVKNGSIVLFHNDGKNTPQALGPIIEDLQKKGFKIVPISEIIYKNDYYVDNNGIQQKNK